MLRLSIRPARGVALVTGVFMTLLVLTAEPAASGSSRETCEPPDVVTSGKLTANNLACTTARRLLRKFFQEVQEEGPDVVIQGFDCHGKVEPNGEFDVRCRKGARRMHFEGAIR
jgi:hypothetical protein